MGEDWLGVGVLQQIACLVVSLVRVGGFAFLFGCVLMSWTSDSVMIPTWILVYGYGGWSLVLWLFFGLARCCLLSFFYLGVQFYVLLSPYLCFIPLVYLGLCVLD